MYYYSEYQLNALAQIKHCLNLAVVKFKHGISFESNGIISLSKNGSNFSGKFDINLFAWEEEMI